VDKGGKPAIETKKEGEEEYLFYENKKLQDQLFTMEQENSKL